MSIPSLHWHSNYATMALIKDELGFHASLKEMLLMSMSVEDGVVDQEIVGVGSGFGGGFYNTSELRPMKYKEAIHVDRKGWTKAVHEEHDRMVTNNVWRPVKKKDVPTGAKVLTLGHAI